MALIYCLWRHEQVQEKGSDYTSFVTQSYAVKQLESNIWHSRSSRHLQCCHPVSALVPVLTAPLLCQRHTNSLGKAKCLGPLHPRGRSIWNFCLLALSWLCPHHCGHVKRKSADEIQAHPPLSNWPSKKERNESIFSLSKANVLTF